MLKQIIQEKFLNRNGIPNGQRFNNCKDSELANQILSVTGFLDSSITFSERIYCILHDISKMPTCKICGNKVSFPKYTIGYNTYCSSNCAAKDPEKQEKAKNTNIQKYGAPSFSASEEGKEKIKQTNVDKYGCENSFQREDVKEKCKQTSIKHCGATHHLQSKEGKKKRKQLMMEKHGVICNLNLPEVKEKALKVQKDNKEEIDQKRKETSIKKYGVISCLVLPETREKARQKNMEEFGVPHNRQRHISPENLEHLHNKEWLTERYWKQHKTFDTIAKELGVSKRAVINNFRKLGIESRHEVFASTEENEVKSFLAKNGISFKPNDRKTLSPYELDMFIPEHNLGIEYNGVFWHSFYEEETNEEINKHISKTNACMEKGINLFQILETDWKNKNNVCKSLILGKLNKLNELTGAHEIKQVEDDLLVQEFLNINSLKGYIVGDLNLGLFVEGELHSLIVANKTGLDYRILSCCTKPGIKTCFPLLLKYFKNNFQFNGLFLHLDRRFEFPDDFPEFEIVEITGARGFYFKLEEKLWENSEFTQSDEDLFEDGYRRIWDCGEAILKLK